MSPNPLWEFPWVTTCVWMNTPKRGTSVTEYYLGFILGTRLAKNTNKILETVWCYRRIKEHDPTSHYLIEEIY